MNHFPGIQSSRTPVIVFCPNRYPLGGGKDIAGRTPSGCEAFWNEVSSPFGRRDIHLLPSQVSM